MYFFDMLYHKSELFYIFFLESFFLPLFYMLYSIFNLLQYCYIGTFLYSSWVSSQMLLGRSE